jgi:phage regulator Rha-like protein
MDLIHTPLTSREMADLTETRHDSVKRTIDTLVEKGVISNPQIVDGERAANGVIENLYAIGKRDSFVVVAQLSSEFTARVVDRWQELTEGVSKFAHTLPTSRIAPCSPKKWTLWLSPKRA